MNIGSILKQISTDRAFMASWLVLALLCVVVTIMLALRIHPSELNTQVRYSAFGVAHIYNSAWYNLLPMVLMSLTILVLHTIVSIKLYLTKDNYVARLFLWLSVVVVIIGAFIGSAVLGLASI